MNATLIERLKALEEWHDAKSALFVSFVNEASQQGDIGLASQHEQDAAFHTAAAATIREAIAELQGERE